MSDEIEDFLRRVAAKRRNRQQQADVQFIPPAQPQVVEAEIVEAEPVRASLSSQVQSYMDTHDVTDHAAHLGEQVGLADDKIEARLQQAFDHKLGRLQDTSTEVGEMPQDADVEEGAPAPPSTAVGLVQLLRSPENLRNAIILSEIFTRPEYRW